MSFASGIPILLGFALAIGGPQAAFSNWTMVGGLSLVSFAIAEIAVAFPTARGIYYWSYRLGRTKFGPFLVLANSLVELSRLDRCRARMSARSYQFLHRGLAEPVLECKHSLQEVAPVCMHDRRIASRCCTQYPYSAQSHRLLLLVSCSRSTASGFLPHQEPIFSPYQASLATFTMVSIMAPLGKPLMHTAGLLRFYLGPGISTAPTHPSVWQKRPTRQVKSLQKACGQAH
jgi:hypothetical protein